MFPNSAYSHEDAQSDGPPDGHAPLKTFSEHMNIKVAHDVAYPVNPPITEENEEDDEGSSDDDYASFGDPTDADAIFIVEAFQFHRKGKKSFRRGKGRAREKAKENSAGSFVVRKVLVKGRTITLSASGTKIPKILLMNR